MKLLLVVAGAAARRAAIPAARAVAFGPVTASRLAGRSAAVPAASRAFEGLREMSSSSGDKRRQSPKASASDSDSSDSDSDDEDDDEEVKAWKKQPASEKTRRQSLKEQRAQEANEWDEDRWGAVDSDDWQGFDGDLDAVTAEGVPTWLQSVRDLSAIHDEKRMRAKLARRAMEEAKKNVVRHRQVDELGRAYGTGRRKTSTARVWVKKSAEPFAGRIVVNKMDLVDYFDRDTHREDVLRPFAIINEVGNFDVYCTVKGGGLTGQSGAVRHGIARALQHFDPELRAPLKKDGLLTRDPRMVERKKPGQPKARKKFQWVKR